MAKQPTQKPQANRSAWDVLDARFPVAMKYAGLVGVAYETLWEQIDRPYLLGLFGTMMGIGQVAQALQTKREQDQ